MGNLLTTCEQAVRPFRRLSVMEWESKTTRVVCSQSE